MAAITTAFLMSLLNDFAESNSKNTVIGNKKLKAVIKWNTLDQHYHYHPKNQGLRAINTALYNCPIYYSKGNSPTSFTFGLSERINTSVFIHLLLRTAKMKAKVMADEINALSLAKWIF